MPRVFKSLKELHLLMDSGTISVIPAGIELVEDKDWYKAKSKKISGRYSDHWVQKSVVENNPEWFMMG